LVEAVGWLIEGVFCGFFDAAEADVVWIRLEGVVSGMTFPAHRATAQQVNQVCALLTSRHPFREALQMTSDRQKRFELPLFPQALLLADRLAADDLATRATGWLWREPQDVADVTAAEPAEPVSPEEVQRVLLREGAGASQAAMLIAGHLRLLEHMQASRALFSYAESRAPHHGGDYESYRERIGGLNAWRVPIFDRENTSRFTILSTGARRVLSGAIAKQELDANPDTFEEEFDRHVRGLGEAWEANHLAGLFAR
jgi:hypothetical protein